MSNERGKKKHCPVAFSVAVLNPQKFLAWKSQNYSTTKQSGKIQQLQAVAEVQSNDAKRELLQLLSKTTVERHNNSAVMVENAVQQLEVTNETMFSFPSNTDILSGKWRLLYTSSSEVPSVGVRDVYQRIQLRKKRIQNIVEVELNLPFLKPSKATLCVGADLLGFAPPNRTILSLTETSFRTTGALRNLPPLRLPIPGLLRADSFGDFLFPLKPQGFFDTTYYDGDMRISRGDRGEVRVFQRAQ
mmetsp:Transcript_28058/g.45519  ORF Transcript_28058/g.45519 Transcript_28058/m.45519 type:complete len:245 (-) Transcript_28058:571-1305(-)|eukprot:CAMPEP_0184674684 /NCGR_PEP_ID=MMETSP0308-20130426/87376_1 /TAXON_ID=38269 /ORGANISM="Gloeochaete witrockiana, Strain SAG 46.84" /LENGTH=244 /DNA_ID=CAMNT_0027122317 /DNA_START=491 /DNA_END=1225 /DNA_ORIENTATION=-